LTGRPSWSTTDTTAPPRAVPSSLVRMSPVSGTDSLNSRACGGDWGRGKGAAPAVGNPPIGRRSGGRHRARARARLRSLSQGRATRRAERSGAQGAAEGPRKQQNPVKKKPRAAPGRAGPGRAGPHLGQHVEPRGAVQHEQRLARLPRRHVGHRAPALPQLLHQRVRRVQPARGVADDDVDVL
jgi:hypothetical protein